MQLDKLDLKIIATLQTDGRITKQALSEKVALSPSACLERIKRLEKEGVITGYGAEVAIGAVTPYSVVLVEITLKNHKTEDFRKFEAAIADIPQVSDCWAVGGGIDYILRFVTRSIEEYQKIIDAMLDDDVGIERYFSFFVTKHIKDTPVDLTTLVG